jgi:hypothetical protein
MLVIVLAASIAIDRQRPRALSYPRRMCIFSRGVRHVGATRIFVGDRADGRQALIYAMEVELAAPTAMVLPLPTPAGCSEDAVEFVSLARYPSLFDDLDRAFPALELSLGRRAASGRVRARAGAGQPGRPPGRRVRRVVRAHRRRPRSPRSAVPAVGRGPGRGHPRARRLVVRGDPAGQRAPACASTRSR